MKDIALMTLLMLALACGSPETQSTTTRPDATTAPPAPSAPATGLMSVDPLVVLSTGVQRVEPKNVCMINERVFANDQIPIQVAGKTYYGCCEMCKTALAQDASKRSAVDPVSKREVDKAVAVIGADKRGRVYYFENEGNLRAFDPPA